MGCHTCSMHNEEKKTQFSFQADSGLLTKYTQSRHKLHQFEWKYCPDVDIIDHGLLRNV